MPGLRILLMVPDVRDCRYKCQAAFSGVSDLSWTKAVLGSRR